MEPGDGKPLLDRAANPLCTRCGLCCVMLSARVAPEEAKVIAEENGLSQDRFCHIEKRGEGPNAGELVLNMPCRFLLGRPMDYVSCRTYARKRPEVCVGYLCRVAIQYKLGVVDLNEGLTFLDKAYRQGRVDIFNWVGKTGDAELQQSVVLSPLRKEAAKMIEEHGENGRLGILDEEQVGDILIAKNLTPTYLVHSDFAHLELNLLLNFFDRRTHELKDIIPQSRIAGWTEEEKSLAMEVYTEFLRKLRSLFATIDEMETRRITDEIVDQVEREEESK